MNSPNDDIDQLLRKFFRSQMPSRLPDVPGADSTTVETARVSADSAWTVASGRVLAGLALAGILAIYLGLASFFPRATPTGLNATQIGERAMPAKAPKK